MINTHLADTLTIAATDINAAFLGLLFTGNEDVVPLVELGVSDLFVELSV